MISFKSNAIKCLKIHLTLLILFKFFCTVLYIFTSFLHILDILKDKVLNGFIYIFRNDAGVRGRLFV